ARRTLQQWRDLFAGSNCCVSPVNTISEALAHYPLDARGMLHRLEHPTLGSVPQVTFPVSAALRDQKRKSFSVEESDRSFSRLLESGFSENEIRSMRDSGIISLYMAD
ncbi:MAG: CoA transferase, partial [Cyanobacteria bacterium HKST-UBA01]|nr:CoA transferase [Cyanobacteria bacterium HKST-UBA01]